MSTLQTAGRTPRELILLLKEIEQRSRRHMAGVPLQNDDDNQWEGILFNVLATPVVAPLREVKEILNLPSSITRVPGTRAWLLGIANVRGNLLPIVDLQLFLGGDPIVIEKRSRVLVVEYQDLRTGLLVGGVQGLRHFADEQRTSPPDVAPSLRQYIQGAFQLERQVWPAFSMNKLAESPAFQMAAA